MSDGKIIGLNATYSYLFGGGVDGGGPAPGGGPPDGGVGGEDEPGGDEPPGSGGEGGAPPDGGEPLSPAGGEPPGAAPSDGPDEGPAEGGAVDCMFATIGLVLASDCIPCWACPGSDVLTENLGLAEDALDGGVNGGTGG